MSREAAVDLFASAPALHLASTREDGGVVLRTVHGVVVGGRTAIAFHGAPAGEKMDILGRRAVLSVEEIVAEIPSYFIDAERACPATTYYRSAQAHGPIERVDDQQEKAEVLSALMKKYQPEGGHVPITADHPLYERAIRGILIAKVSLEDVDGKGKLGQNRSPDELARVLELLWARGLAGDPRAIDQVCLANPEVKRPRFLDAPNGALLFCAGQPADLDGTVQLLRSEYWNEDVAEDTIKKTHLGSTVWVGARERDTGRMIATARALSDGGKRAFIFDVAVDGGWRGRGLGRAVVRLLLDHPSVRGAREVRLATRDAQRFYAGFGFKEVPRGDSRHPQMLFSRAVL